MSRAKFLLCYSVMLLTSLMLCQLRFAQAKRVAVIGGGVAGSATTYFLSDLMKETVEPLHISVFEKNEIVGGRIREIEFAGKKFELGASIFIDQNYYMANFTQQFDFPLKPDGNYVVDTFGVYDGKELLFSSSSNNFINKLKMLWRYGFTPTKVEKLAEEALAKFIKLYSLQENHITWTSVEEAYLLLGLADLTLKTAEEYFVGENHINKKFVDEIVTGASMDNYNQGSSQLNALVSLVSMSGSYQNTNTLLNGNSQIVRMLLNQTHSMSPKTIQLQVATNHQVISITKTPQNTYVVDSYNSTSGSSSNSEFDIVVVASPLFNANITFNNIDLPENALLERDYQTTYVTMVASKGTNPGYFGLGRFGKVPDMLMTTEFGDSPFSALAILDIDEKTGTIVYKLFSKQELSDELLQRLFVDISEVYRHKWEAYPKLTPTKAFPPIVLSENLFYANAFEYPISCMETEMISAKNIALLISQIE